MRSARLAIMNFERVAHVVLALYVGVGYVAAYRYARSGLKKGIPWQPGTFARYAVSSLTVIMPISAAIAFAAGWHSPSFRK